MKDSTLQTLMVSKLLFLKSKELIEVGGVHACTAGLILLQDAIELAILGILNEIDEEQKNYESKSFDELLGELKKYKINIHKSGTLKALNKQRVIAKHYGQMSEVSSVQNYYNVSEIFLDNLLKDIFGKNLLEIHLYDILENNDVKEFICSAIEAANQNDFVKGLILLRRAFYKSYEHQYSVYPFRHYEVGQNSLFGIGF